MTARATIDDDRTTIEGRDACRDLVRLQSTPVNRPSGPVPPRQRHQRPTPTSAPTERARCIVQKALKKSLGRRPVGLAAALHLPPVGRRLQQQRRVAHRERAAVDAAHKVALATVVAV